MDGIDPFRDTGLVKAEDVEMHAPQLGCYVGGHAELRQEDNGPVSSELVVCLSERRE